MKQMLNTVSVTSC